MNLKQEQRLFFPKLLVSMGLCLILSSAQCQAKETDWLSIRFSNKQQSEVHRRTVKDFVSRYPYFGQTSTDGMPSDSKVVPAAKQHEFPGSVVGKLVFRFPDTENRRRSCTAFFSGNAGVIATAAHCVMSYKGSWLVEPVFIQAFGAPFQQFHSISCAAVHESWGRLEGDDALRYDYAFLKVSVSNKDNEYLEWTDELGQEGIRILGYSNKCCGGQKLFELKRSHLQVEEHGLRLSSLNNTLGEGSSGAPWIDVESGRVVSLNSSLQGLNATQINGPRLGKEFHRLFEFVNNDCAE